jgi:hypothetical protein
MTGLCPVTCGTCSTYCTDNDRMMAVWATQNPGWPTTCTAANTTHYLDAIYRVACGASGSKCSGTPTPSPSPSPTVCTDTDNGALDVDDYGCSDYSAVYCGGTYDDADFFADRMCCVCGGGSTYVPTYVPPAPAPARAAPAPPPTAVCQDFDNVIASDGLGVANCAAASGYCNSNLGGYVKAVCPVTCGNCANYCTDQQTMWNTMAPYFPAYPSDTTCANATATQQAGVHYPIACGASSGKCSGTPSPSPTG